MKHIKYLLLIAILFIFPKIIFAQSTYTYGNEWINPSQEYWKFYIGASATHKIDYNKLVELGLGNVPGNQFAIYNLGKEIPIYVTTDGIFGPNDYIMVPLRARTAEFDNLLYVNPNDNPNINVPNTYNQNPYFLTYSAANHLRFTKVVNPIPNPLPTNATYMLQKIVGRGGQVTVGKSYSSTNTYVSSNYDIGEGQAIGNVNTLAKNMTANLTNRYNLDPNLKYSLKTTIYNGAAASNNIKITVLGTVLLDTIIQPFSQIKINKEFPGSIITGNSATFAATGSRNFTVFDWEVVSYQLPNLYLLGISAYNSFAQYIIPKDFDYYNFTSGNWNHIIHIFDYTHLNYYETVSPNNTTKRVLFNPSSVDREIIMARSTLVTNISNIYKVNLNLSLNNLEKNYLILTDSVYLNASPNYINDYVNYRNSPSGGGYIAGAVNVNDLYDLFAYGHVFHPLAIKNFLKYALDNWQNKPEHLFIIGKGLQPHLYTSYIANPSNYNFTPIPTWGHPGTDNLFSSFTTNGKTMPEIATGRISARNNEDIGKYLEKVKAYEETVRENPNIKQSLWKKEVLHIAGGGDIALQNSIIADLDDAKTIIEDTLFNGRVTTIYKRSTDPMTQNADQRIDSFINEGVRIITFYGHANPSGFDYNLNSPEIQNSKPNFPIFNAYGCDVADIFLLTNTNTISENYINSSTGGAIAMIASNNLGWTSIIPYHMQGLYKEFAKNSYFKTLGQQYQANIKFINTNYFNEYFNIHTQSFLLQGDPGLQLGNPTKPDLAIEDQYVSIAPANINVTTGEFKVNAKYYNIGIATKDSFWIKLEHTKISNGQILYQDSFRTSLKLMDSLIKSIPISSQSVGLTRLKISLDFDEQLDEIFESNNEVNIDVNIYEEDLIPIYPYEFSIVNDNKVTLKASTLNTFATNNKYIIELDTTELFNSPIKQAFQTSSLGGTIHWTPTGSFLDSTVYYWRTAIDTLINNDRKWNYSSFITIKNGYPGWNQSHYYQWLKDKNVGIGLNANRKFSYEPYVKKYTSTNLTVYNSTISRQNEIHDDIDGQTLNIFSCWFGYNTIQIGIIDTATGEPLPQSVVCAAGNMVTNNEFHVNTAANRNNAMNFIRNLPSGYYITVKTIVFQGNYNGATMSPVAWQADTAIYGSGNSLYHALKELGFTAIDQTNTTQRKTILFFTKKGDPNYTPIQKVSNGDEKIFIEADIPVHLEHGQLHSVDIGPSAKWESFHWNLETLDNRPQNDTNYIEIYGLDNSNVKTLLYAGTARDTSLSFIDASIYPKINLTWTSRDTVNLTSQHKQYWRVHYQPLPEAALNPLKQFEIANDSLGYGENLTFKIAVENISDYEMDSMLVRYRVVDQNNVSHELDNKRFKKLVAGDTVNVGLSMDIKNFSGLNYLFIEANPYKDQPEQFHPNNIGAFPFYVYTDNRNPLLDVTFDGIRILDKDIVSAKPLIKILLNDENKNLLLKDTSLFEVSLATPSNISNPMKVNIDGTICKFFPASDGEKNEAYLEYRPELLEDGIYKLIVKAKDNSGNKAGNFDKYEVNFTVDNTPGITNLLNYPNPFSTSTAFVFTLTGHQIPSQFKIQILSVTGKVVREITKEELGPLHIGRNITQYKWDGKDQYGQLLGNGVYLYRVITHINGEKLEHRANKNVDKYFKEGYGKMYIMR